MKPLTRAVLTEHGEFATHIDELRRIADDCGDERTSALVDDLDGVLRFLEHELLPHATAEDEVLYPAVAKLLGGPAATATMSRDHAEIAHLVTELRRHRDELGSALVPVATHEVRRLLYGLHAILVLHVAKEEEVYLPLLDRSLDDGASDELLRRVRLSARLHRRDPAADAAAAVDAG